MEATGCVIEGAICTCATAQNPRRRPQVLPAYGLQDLRDNHQNPKTKSHPNTMCLQITLGENHGSGHFYPAKNRTFLLCVDTNLPTAQPRRALVSELHKVSGHRSGNRVIRALGPIIQVRLRRALMEAKFRNLIGGDASYLSWYLAYPC
jgi:hypothetical protein